MSWHARRLVDLADRLASWFNRRRYDTLARHLGRSPELSNANRRGFVIVQIDGLAYDYLVEAIARGAAPRLRRLLSSSQYRLARWRCGLPSTTPAVQAGLMFGNAFDIPGFRWYEKDKGWSVECKLPRSARMLQARVTAANPGILRGGSSYVSLLDGDAGLSLLTLGSLADGRFLENVKGVGFLLLFLLSPLRVARVAALSVWEYLRDFFKRLVALLVPGYYRSPHNLSPFLNVIVNVLFRELQTFSAYLDIHRGTPAIFTNYYGYDEAAHHSGPNSSEAWRTLRGIDLDIGRLERLARRAQRRQYDFYVISDHGQTLSKPFRQLYGKTLGQLIVENIESTASIDEQWNTGEQMSEAKAQILLAELRDIEKRLRPTGARLLRAARRFIDERVPFHEQAEWNLARRNDVVVRNSGSLAHVYFNVNRRALNLSDIALLYPRLLTSLLEHPGIGWIVGRQGDQVVVMNHGGTLTLGNSAHVEGHDPLAGLPEPSYAARQLLQLAHYPHSGDLILLGAWHDGQVVGFEDQVASHGGLGGPQDYPFIIYPSNAPPSIYGQDGAASLYKHFMRYHSAGDGDASDSTSDITCQESPSRRKVSLRP